MLIAIAGIERNDVGGGGTFAHTLRKGLSKLPDVQFTDYEHCEALIISGASLIDRETVEKAKAKGVAIILRVDNILEDNRNKNSGMPRIIEYAKLADTVVYQSNWAKRLMEPYAGKGMVIRNGVDTDVFYPRTEAKTWDGIRVFYSKYSRGDGKNFNVVQYFWREYCLDKRGDTLVLVGRFADELQRANHPFEFHNQEDYEFYGVKDSQQMAEIMRSCDVALLPYFADACSNTILETQACGLPVIYEEYGGCKEIVDFGCKLDWDYTPTKMVELALGQKKDYHPEDHKAKWGYEEMALNYYGICKVLLANQSIEA